MLFRSALNAAFSGELVTEGQRRPHSLLTFKLDLNSKYNLLENNKQHILVNFVLHFQLGEESS